MSDHRAIFKSASIISGLTIVSRVTGFVRDVLIAQAFGTGAAAQAFFVAFKIPNMFRDLMGEGAGNAAFVPVFCEYLERRPRREFLRLVHNVFLVICVSSSAVVCLGVIFSPFVIRLVAPGFLEDATKFHLTILLNRILFPYLFLVTVSAFLMAVANACKSFAIPAATSIAFNVVMIAGLLVMTVMGSGQILVLAWLTLAAGLAQVAVQLPSLKKLGVFFLKGGWSAWPWREEGVQKIGRLIGPRMVGTSIYQLNIFVDTIVGSLTFFAGEGAIAAIYFANRIVQFPFSIFGVALSNAALPSLSGAHAKGDRDQLKKTLAFCLKAALIGLVPLTVGLVLFAWPLVRVVYQRGHFDVYSTDVTARAVLFYSLGLFFYAGVRFLSHAFFAMQDTRTPVKTAAVSFGVNLLLIAVLVFGWRFRIAGLALSSSIASCVNFFLLYRVFRQKTGFSLSAALRNVLVKVLAASCAMGLFLIVLWNLFWPDASGLTALLLSGLMAACVYIGLLWFFKVEELKELASWISRRR
jgi:putative peptidoglycan lipid II flippase